MCVVFFLWVVRTLFKMRCVPLILVDLLGTHKKIISCLEKILERLEVRKFTFCQKRPWRAGSLNPSKSMSKVNFSTISVFCGAFFFSTGRTDLIQSALCSPDPGEPPRYSQKNYIMFRKNFRATWSQKVHFWHVFWRVEGSGSSGTLLTKSELSDFKSL